MSARPDRGGVVGLVPAAPLSALLLVVVNLLPVAGVLTGHVSMSEVFILYWLENVAVWAVTIVKVATARGELAPGSTMRVNGRPVGPLGQLALAAFFAVHYGFFTLFHAGFAFSLAGRDGGADSAVDTGTVLLAGAGLAVSHVVSLALNWFGRGERRAVAVDRAMLQPYPRMVVLHASTIGGFFLLVGTTGAFADGLDRTAQAGPVLLLCGLKTVLDLWFHLRERRRAAEAGARGGEEGGGGSVPGAAASEPGIGAVAPDAAHS